MEIKVWNSAYEIGQIQTDVRNYYGSKKMEKEMKIKDYRLMIESCKKKIFKYY